MKILYALIFTILLSVHSFAQDVPNGKPDASVDLATADGAKLVGGSWKYSDTKIVETSFNAAGADNQPSGPSVKTYDYTPHAGGADFDDSAWETVAANDLSKRRGNGRLSFNWYRINDNDPGESEWSFDRRFDGCFSNCSRRLCRGLGQRRDRALSGAKWRLGRRRLERS